MSERFRQWIARSRRRLIAAALLLLLGGIYLLLALYTPFRIPCPFRAVTGLACPGCGITHLFMDLARLRFADAARQNLAVAALTPVWAVALLARGIFRPRCLRSDGRLFQTLTFASLAFLLLFGVLRNLPGLEFLLPLYLQSA